MSTSSASTAHSNISHKLNELIEIFRACDMIKAFRKDYNNKGELKKMLNFLSNSMYTRLHEVTLRERVTGVISSILLSLGR